MSRTSEAYERLTVTMLTVDPACNGDDRFTDDDQVISELAPICRGCPLLDLCRTFAELDRPKAGIWAGKRYRQNNTKERDFENEHAV